MSPLVLSLAAVSWNLPLWTVAPFALLLLAIALLPLAAPHFWESNRNKLIVALACGIPAAWYMARRASELGVPFGHDHPLVTALHDYAGFILLLFALFTISGGIHVRGTLAGTPSVNTGLLAIGGLIASLVGTTGASMLLIRPLLRANAVRRKKTHVVVFFIFIVSNCGGLLTPLGDPPLFLGFLHGVPFGWTLSLWREWLLVNGLLLVLFQFVDAHFFHREDVQDKAHDLDQEVEKKRTPFGLEGGVNFVLLLGVIAVVFFSGQQHWGEELPGLQEGALLVLALISLVVTSKQIRSANQFSFGPIVEVAVLFLGIFLSMVPALLILNARGGELGVTTPVRFFWASGTLSSFLDNAPTYMTFASVAAGAHGIAAEGRFLGDFLDPANGPVPAQIVAAIACGSVFMGANTYIGNGPNFMVKAIAEQAGVKMPSFFGYMAWSGAILIPLFVVVTLACF